MSGTRQALILGAIPIFVGGLYLLLQVGLGEAASRVPVLLGVDLETLLTGTLDPAGIVMLIALGLAMGFGMLVILRGARDL